MPIPANAAALRMGKSSTRQACFQGNFPNFLCRGVTEAQMDTPICANRTQSRQLLEILRLFQVQPADQLRVRHDMGARRQQAACDQAGFFIIDVTHAQGHIHGLVEQVDAAACLQYFQLHPGVALQELADQVRQQRHARWR